MGQGDENFMSPFYVPKLGTSTFEKQMLLWAMAILIIQLYCKREVNVSFWPDPSTAVFLICCKRKGNKIKTSHVSQRFFLHGRWNHTHIGQKTSPEVMQSNLLLRAHPAGHVQLIFKYLWRCRFHSLSGKPLTVLDNIYGIFFSYRKILFHFLMLCSSSCLFSLAFRLHRWKVWLSSLVSCMRCL